MQERFALRFESGDRSGETVGIPSAGLSLGRRPGNSVQILDASVSGKHAELAVDARGVVLRDLGSTNGTLVGHERVSAERRLAHGDLVVLGKVRLCFIDREVDPNPAATAGLELEGDVAAAPAAGGEALRRVSADQLARSGKRSILVGIALALVVGAGAAAWWFLGRGGGETAGPRRPVLELPGDLLSGRGAFEAELDGWDAPDDATGSFLVDGAAAASGASGVRATLASGEWAALRSPDARATAGQALAARAELGATGGARIQLGLQFHDSRGGREPLVAWSDAASDEGSPVTREVASAVPPGYDRARALICARAVGEAGEASADDVALLAASGVPAAPKVGEFLWLALGEPPRAGLLGKLDRPLLSNLRVVAEGADPRFDAAPLAARPVDDGFELALPGGAARTLALVVEPEVVAQGLATLGAGGLRTHQVEFRREGVESLLVGSGLDLVRLRFDPPATLAGAPSGAAFRVEARLADSAPGDGPAAGGVAIQVAFQAERAFADGAARRAREAEKQGRLGECLATWKELLDRAPFDAALVREAEGARARLIQQGLAEVQQAKQAAERARFFRLADLFRQCRDGARAIAERYAASEVATAALELVDEIERDRLGLEQDLGAEERERLRAILAALEAAKQVELAARVREVLDALSKGTQ